MNPWIPLVLLSVVAGAGAGAAFKGRKAVFMGGAVPWCAFLGWLLYNEYVLPYQGGGASMWPVAQLFGGSAAALVGAGTAAFVGRRMGTR